MFANAFVANDLECVIFGVRYFSSGSNLDKIFCKNFDLKSNKNG